MNFMYIIAGSIILILAWHLGAADSITTTMVGPDPGVQQPSLYR